MPAVKPPYQSFAKIKVIGVGGSGNNAVQHMAAQDIRGVVLAAVNTDAQDLHHSKVGTKLHIGKNTTRGLGAGMNPDQGRQAAEESREEIRDLVADADMVFVTCGLGGGTGSGASPIVAEAAREAGALTIGVVTKPFSFEGRQRARIANEAWAQLRRNVDAIVTIENDRVLDVIDKQTSLLHAFRAVNEVLHQAVSGIAEVISTPAHINVDFADVKAIMENAGTAHMGIGKGSGTSRLKEAAENAIKSPLVNTSITGATGVLFTVVGGPGIGMQEVNDAAQHIIETVDPEARIIFGVMIDRKMPQNAARVTVLATGLRDPQQVHDVPEGPGPRALKTPMITMQGGGNGNGETNSNGNGNGNGHGHTQPKPQQAPVATVGEEDEDPWQMPAFIRRKLKDMDEEPKGKKK
jgi:cell division protein FtsZ